MCYAFGSMYLATRPIGGHRKTYVTIDLFNIFLLTLSLSPANTSGDRILSNHWDRGGQPFQQSTDERESESAAGETFMSYFIAANRESIHAKPRRTERTVSIEPRWASNAPRLLRIYCPPDRRMIIKVSILCIYICQLIVTR